MVAAYRDALKPVATEIANHEGGRVFEADQWTRLRRFLILGTEKGTFYAGEIDLTIENIGVVKACLAEDWLRTVSEIATVSDQGIAPKNDPAILALAMATLHSEPSARKAAFAIVPGVCRTGTHILTFANYRKLLGGGWGRGMKSAIRKWFTDKEPRALVYQLVKYPSRYGWAMADLLKLSHPKMTGDHSLVAQYVLGKMDPEKPWWMDFADQELAKFLTSCDNARQADGLSGLVVDALPTWIRKHHMPREALNTIYLNDRNVWDALLADMPMTAMIRNLGKMTSVGLIVRGSDAEHEVVERLGNMGRIQAARIHPINVLSALKVYEMGHGIKGSLSWTPSKRVVNALDEAFYLTFGNVEPSGKRIRLAVDVSASMDGSQVNGMDFLDAREAAAAMALVTLATEPHADIVAYSHRMVPIPVRPSMRLDEVQRVMKSIEMGGGTLCSLPITEALRFGEHDIDAFVSYTDSETFDGGPKSAYYRFRDEMSVNDALIEYRHKSGRKTRHAVCAFASNGFTLADPYDPGQLDLVGLDSSLPQVLAAFVAGKM